MDRVDTLFVIRVANFNTLIAVLELSIGDYLHIKGN